MVGSEISIHHAFYWQKCLITHQIKQDGQPGSDRVQRKHAPFKWQTFFSSKCGDWTCDAETQKFLRINFHARCCDRFMPGKLWGKYSVGSDSWCRADVRGGICRWRTCMRCFDPDGLGQYSGDRWGKRKEVSCSHHRFSLFLTHLQPCSICYIFFPPIQHVLPCTLPQI